MAAKQDCFSLRYCKYSTEDGVYPSRAILRHIKGTEFSCPVEAIRLEHWNFLFSALSEDNTLTKLHLASCVSPHEPEDSTKTKKSKQNKRFPTPYGRSERNISDICDNVNVLLHCSQTLVILKLENLSLGYRDAERLAVGLSQSVSLKYFSLAGCRIEEGGIGLLGIGLLKTNISWLDFSSCALSMRDLHAIFEVIKKHTSRRANAMYPDTLRNRIPNLQDYLGLTRLSLNYNRIEFQAIHLLYDILIQDFWVKGLDLQNCGIDDEGAGMLLKLIKENNTLVLIDLRLNRIDERLLHRISEQLELNKAGKDVNFAQLPLWRPSDLVRKYNAIGRVKTLKKTPLHRFKVSPRASKCFIYSAKLPPPVDEDAADMKDASVQTRINEPKELPKMDYVIEMKNKLRNEMQMKKLLVSKYNQIKAENDHLREMLKNQSDEIFIDQETYLEIKHTFEKLKIFFDVMKKYGLWEYVSMLGFEESPDVIIEENDSLQCLKFTRKEISFGEESRNKTEPNRDICCNCRKIDSKHKHSESANGPIEVAQNCIAASTAKSSHKSKIAKTEIPKDKVAYTFLQEAMNDFSGSLPIDAPCMKAVSGKMIDLQDNIKPSSSKQLDSTQASVLFNRYAYGSMHQKFKEFVSPKNFHDIMKQELEKCESEVMKPFYYTHAENSTAVNAGSEIIKQSIFQKTGSEPAKQVVHQKTDSEPAKQFVHQKTDSEPVKQIVHQKMELEGIKQAVHQKSSSEFINQSILQKTCSEPAKQSMHQKTAHALAAHDTKESSRLSSVLSNDEDHDNMTINELIARERALRQAKKESAKSSVSSLPSSKIHKNKNHAKIKETKSIRCEQMLPKSKLKHSNSETSCKKNQTRSNVSSDEINSSDSIVTASDKLSHSSASSSSSNKSHGKSSSFEDRTESEPQKSYLESVSDASTFKDVESISDTEFASQLFSPVESEKEQDVSKDKSASSVKATGDRSVSSQSSTLKSASQSKQSKPNNSESSSAKDTSRKSDKSTKTSTPSKGKTKNANKHGKNRPKNNSSKSSSVPSLSDITSVSSQSLNTDSVMKQISGSDDSKGGK